MKLFTKLRAGNKETTTNAALRASNSVCGRKIEIREEMLLLTQDLKGTATGTWSQRAKGCLTNCDLHHRPWTRKAAILL
jgi:hypothetical protein